MSSSKFQILRAFWNGLLPAAVRMLRLFTANVSSKPSTVCRVPATVCTPALHTSARTGGRPARGTAAQNARTDARDVVESKTA